MCYRYIGTSRILFKAQCLDRSWNKFKRCENGYFLVSLGACICLCKWSFLVISVISNLSYNIDVKCTCVTWTVFYFSSYLITRTSVSFSKNKRLYNSVNLAFKALPANISGGNCCFQSQFNIHPSQNIALLLFSVSQSSVPLSVMDMWQKTRLLLHFTHESTNFKYPVTSLLTNTLLTQNFNTRAHEIETYSHVPSPMAGVGHKCWYK